MTDSFRSFITLNGCSVLHPRTEMGRLLMPVTVRAVPPAPKHESNQGPMTFAGLLSTGIIQNSFSERHEMSAPESYKAAAGTGPICTLT
jgi:hypothetical protein